MQACDSIAAIENGKAPLDAAMLDSMSTGSSFIVDFWKQHYLDEFIRLGGSSVKFLVGRSGSGKTHTLLLLQQQARSCGFINCFFSAKDVWLNDFRQIYLQVLDSIDLDDLISRLSGSVINRMGYEPSEVPAGKNFITFLSDSNDYDGLTLRYLRQHLREAFLDNPMMDNDFGQIMSMLVGSQLGYPQLDASNRDFLVSWLHADGTQKIPAIRAQGLAPYKITKYNARHMLRSLLSAVSLAGYSGVFVCIDDLEAMVSASPMDQVHYTKMKRDDTLESIRQLIDDIDSFHNVMFVFSGGRELVDNERFGFKSYQALWMRIQNEVVGAKVNRFAGIIDLDKAERQTFTPAMLVEMSQKLVKAVGQNLDAIAIDEADAERLLSQAKMGDVPIPLLVNQATLRKLQNTIKEGDNA
ncbi:MAG: DUF2791 family P-loop domain-containing protein [Sphaerochaetaceae bacterium]|jgi:hypothetical protein|nr:DUF2791 family P-loop domain-containing protein [Sphaerochaetaceae bacterium]MDD3163856.1 DUF2791 family P-loop domain-containing protein [Sphaerochaetaceae bacterium]MDD4007749.1 DUF2791 family P-loop domain-containing protein [Sphaerochaetaceae bacterium]MDD4396857.1 DUF2791 family P-loop domain-containing protein [Sphaerochaetaceae bacterium]